MSTLVSIIIILIILIVFHRSYYKNSHFNTREVKPCAECDAYNVHSNHHDPKKAAQLLEEIVNRNKKFVDHIKNKYLHSNLQNMNPDKSGRIDVIPQANPVEDVVMAQIQYLPQDMEYLSNRVMQLTDRYNVDQIYEISPLNAAGNTSYTENKGEKLVLCLREKEKNNSGQNEFHDINLIMFVVLHELTHIMNDRWGHETQYWRMFKFVILNAAEAGIYTPVDYSKHPQVYCGMNITYNPYFDPTL